MQEIIVTTQKELDNVKVDFDGIIKITGGTSFRRIVVSKKYEYRVVAWENSSVEARENSSVEAWGNSSVVAWENSSVVARENSSVEARENSSVEAWENSSVEAWENSSVVARENSSVVACGNSSVVAWGNSSIHLYSDFATITLFFLAVCWVKANGKVIKKSKTATVIKVPDFKSNIKNYEDRFPIKIENKKAILYKAVHKIDEKYIADYDKKTEYKLGRVIEIKCDNSVEKDCSFGINIAHKSWARSFGINWKDMALLEVETDIKNIIVTKNCDGKVRTSKIKVLREVPRSEWYKFN
jgi:hypothetical protein